MSIYEKAKQFAVEAQPRTKEAANNRGTIRQGISSL
jgi:hypothetical protein